MIELKVTGICAGCPAIDLDIVRLQGNGRTVETAVICRNGQMCRHLEMYISSDIVGSDTPKVEELEI